MVVVFRGITGVGKSTLADILMGRNKLWEEHPDYVSKSCEWTIYIKELKDRTKDYEKKRIFSSDNYFMVDGEYKFNGKLLSEAHNDCLRSFTKTVTTWEHPSLLIVDNTNCSLVEVAPYAALAISEGHELKIITLIDGAADCAARNVHKVPTKNVLKQWFNLDESLRNFPAWWPQDVFFM